MARDRKTVREDRVSPPEGATVRESAAPRGATVREGRPTIQEGRPAVRRGGATVREGPATARESGSAARGGGTTVREGRPAARGGGATVREDRPTDPEAAPPQPRDGRVAGWLPPVLAADYRIVEPLPARGGEADLYVVEPRRPSPDAGGSTRRVAKVYRQDIMPKEDAIRRVQGADPAHVVRLEAYGQDAGRWWELMEHAPLGSLRQLLEREGPRLPDDLVRDILGQLNDALAGLHALPLEHRDLKPGNILVRSRTPLELVLTDFGISSVMQATMRQTDTARTLLYAPPEAIGSVVSDEAERRSQVVIEHTTWDYWSLGMMLVEMLQGEHPYESLSEALVGHRLATQPVDSLTERIADPAWRKLCQGLLRRIPSDRWDAAAVSKWLADPNDPSLAVAQEAQPAAATPTAHAMPGAAAPTANTITFDGARYATPADLGAALSRDWGKAESFWMRRFRDVRTWLTDTLGLRELGDALAGIDDADLPLDAQVFSFVYHLAPDAPLRFRDADISPAGLAALAERAVNDGDARARDTLLALHRQGILTMAAALPGQEAPAQVAQRWQEAVDDYERLRSETRARGVRVPAPDDDELASLLAASLPVASVVAALRARAREADTEDARRCRWFREFGAPEDRGRRAKGQARFLPSMPAAALVMLPRLHPHAARVGRSLRTAPLRGGFGGLVVGALFGIHVEWVAGLTDFAVDSFEEFWSLLGGVLRLAFVIVVFVFVSRIYDPTPANTGNVEDPEDAEDGRGFLAGVRALRRNPQRRRRGHGGPAA